MGLIGGIVGSLIGIAGGVFGSYCSIRAAKGPRERAFAIRCTVAAWVLCALFLAVLFAGLFLVPAPWGFLAWVLYPPMMLLIIPMNRRWQQIRAEESGLSS